jgi:hypothetical protein
MATYYLEGSALATWTGGRWESPWMRHLLRADSPHDFYAASDTLFRGQYRASPRIHPLLAIAATRRHAAELQAAHALSSAQAIELALALAVHRARIARGDPPLGFVTRDPAFDPLGFHLGLLVDNPDWHERADARHAVDLTRGRRESEPVAGGHT